MSQVPYRLQYALDRRQRLMPHLAIWGSLGPLNAMVLALALLGVRDRWWLVLAALPWLWVFRGFYVGLADVLLHRTVRMDLVVEENGLGVLLGTERWWLFLDGLLSAEQLSRGVWTLQHFSGIVINIPGSAIRPEQLEHLRSAVQRGREHMRALVEQQRSSVRPSQRDIPGWVLPLLMTAICGGMAWFVVSSAPPHLIGPWFVLGCAALGLLIGSAVVWIGRKHSP